MAPVECIIVLLTTTVKTFFSKINMIRHDGHMYVRVLSCSNWWPSTHPIVCVCVCVKERERGHATQCSRQTITFNYKINQDIQLPTMHRDLLSLRRIARMTWMMHVLPKNAESPRYEITFNYKTE